MLVGVHVKLRYSLDGTLEKQAVVEGTLRYPPIHDPRYIEVGGDRTSDRRSIVLLSRIIDVVPRPVITPTGVTHGRPPTKPAPSTTCPTYTCHPEIPKWQIHCGKCPCCPQRPILEGP